MSTEIDFSALSASLSAHATITFPTGNFAKEYANWTDFNVGMPLAVIKPSVEADIIATIRWAGVLHLRVAVRGGGHSAFNTTSGGLLLDLREYKAVEYDEASQILTVRGGATDGDALRVLAKNNRCALAGACNGVGFIALYLGGGFGPLMPKLGLGVDNLISARLFLASGEIMTASSTENRDVFDSIRGGGQIMGIVHEIQVETYPLAETLNTTDGTVWSGTVELPADRAADVAKVLERMKMTRDMVMYMIVEHLPPKFHFFLSYYGSDEQADAAFADLFVLKPPTKTGRVDYVKMNDWNERSQEVGDFKRFFGVGLQKVSAGALVEVVRQFGELLNKSSDFSRTYIFFQFLGMEKARESSAGIYPHRWVDYWCLPVLWYKDPKNHGVGERWGLKTRETIKTGDTNSKKAVYTNFRAGMETEGELWGSKGSVNKLKEMKNRLDPRNMFQSFPGS